MRPEIQKKKQSLNRKLNLNNTTASLQSSSEILYQK